MIKKHMPSPVGHALAGVAAAWAVDLLPGRRVWRTAAPKAPARHVLFGAFFGAYFGAFSSAFLIGAGGALTLVAAALGMAPDLDLFLAQHRAITHSVGAVAAIFIVAGVVTGQVTRKVQRSKVKGQRKFKVESRPEGGKFSIERVLRVAMICAAAYGSHLLLDWLAIDRRTPYGLQVWWPFSDGWYVSGLDFFPQTERRNLLSLATLLINAKAMSYETAVMLPVLGLLWLVRVKTVTRLSTEAARRHHAP
jgi:membrane-bound metal-dependent hydrolase YbcI (DUF457 family)